MSVDWLSESVAKGGGGESCHSARSTTWIHRGALYPPERAQILRKRLKPGVMYVPGGAMNKM